MSLLLLAIFFLWTIRITANLLSYIHLWFIKEYRFDRMLIHLKTEQGKWIYFLPLRRPPVSPKTLALFLLTGLSLWLLFLRLPFSLLIKLVILDVASFPVTGVWVLLLSIPTRVYHEVLIWLAVRKLRLHTLMKVVGITGSYGKTSTKEFLATILSTKYKVLKTAASKNSPIGIAEVILNNLKPEHEVFVVEMGAYKPGEIARMCRMVAPQIGIVTAINTQHQDLFGSIENTMKAKYELVASLPHQGVAIFNLDNKFVSTMAEWAKIDGKTAWCYTKDVKNNSIKPEQAVRATEISTRVDGIEFTVTYAGKHQQVSAQVLGEHQVSNILAATTGALVCGMDLKEVCNAIDDLRPYPKSMEKIKGVRGATFINDTFNNNPDAAEAALAYLSRTSGQKIFVFQPMIELGDFAKSAHQEVGNVAAKICDAIFLTNRNFNVAFRQGAKQSNPRTAIYSLGAPETARHIVHLLRPGDTVVFKGKEAEKVLRLLLKHV